MKGITMTADQTAIYDDGSEQEQIGLMAKLRKQAQALADRGGQTVEIYTADGIVAEAVRPNA